MLRNFINYVEELPDNMATLFLFSTFGCGTCAVITIVNIVGGILEMIF